MRPLNRILALRRRLGAPVTAEVIEEAVIASMPERLLPHDALPGVNHAHPLAASAQPSPNQVRREIGAAVMGREHSDIATALVRSSVVRIAFVPRGRPR